MRKNAKRTSKSTQAKKKADVKDLPVKNPSAVKGGISFTKYVDKGTAL